MSENFPESFANFWITISMMAVDRSILCRLRIICRKKREREREKEEEEITTITKLKSSDNFEIIITPSIYPFFEFMECENKL